MNIDISTLSESQLHELNHKIVGRLQSLRQSRTYEQLAKFTPGERVWFENQEGRRVEGLVIRVNKKTVSVRENAAHQWNVSPCLLKKASAFASVSEVTKPLQLNSAPTKSAETVEIVKLGSDTQCRSPVHFEMEPLWDEYIRTEWFSRLSENTKSYAMRALSYFAETMHQYEGYLPSQWTASSFEKTMIETIPRKLSASDDFFAAFPPVLKSFCKFLVAKTLQPEAAAFVSIVDRMADRFLEAVRYRPMFGLPPYVRMAAVQAGVDISDRDKAEAFAAKYLAGLSNVKNKVGRNDSCPCGSGKKYKKCCLGEN